MSADTTRRLAPFRAAPLLDGAEDAEAIRLTERQREQLAAISTRQRVSRRTMIFSEHSPAQWVWAVTEGVVKSYRELRSGRQLVCAFMFPRDLFGLAECGRYVNSARAVTDVIAYRLPIAELAILLKHDGDLQYGFLAKVTHELRESQRRAIVLNRRDAKGRLAMFLVQMGHRVDASASRAPLVPLPMTRSDIAAYLGLSLETVSRAARALEHRGLVRFEGRHAARVLDARGLARLAVAQ
jgi:CRP-like cAMP-binding protein